MSIDLSVQLGQLKLRSPIIIGSCPLNIDELQRISMISNGAGAIVLPSFIIEKNSKTESDIAKDFGDYLQQIEMVSSQSSIPVFASFHGTADEQWRDLPAQAAQAGAAAIEISLRNCHSDETSPRKIEDAIVKQIEEIDKQFEIPLFVKLTPNFTSISDLARRLRPFVEGLIMFGRAPVVDIELDSLRLSTQWGLTPAGSIVRSIEPLMRTRHEYPQMPLIACGGIGSSVDLIKALMCGAQGAMVTSALYRNGVSVIGLLKEGLKKYMSDHGVQTISQLHSLCPPIEEIQQQIESSIFESPVRRQEIASTGDQQHPSTGDRFGHPVS